MRHAQAQHPVNSMQNRSFLVTLAVASVLSGCRRRRGDQAGAPNERMDLQKSRSTAAIAASRTPWRLRRRRLGEVR